MSEPDAQAPPSSDDPDATAEAAAASEKVEAEKRVEQKLMASKLTTNRKRKEFFWYYRAGDPDSDHDLAVPGTLYVRIHTIVDHGVKLETADTKDEAPPAMALPTAKEKLAKLQFLSPHLHLLTAFRRKQRLTDSWEILKAAIPNFGNDMIALGGNLKLRKKIQDGLQGARGDDCGLLKTAVPSFLPPPDLPAVPGQATAPAPMPPGSEPVPAPPPAIPQRGKKAPRGFNHPDMARAIHPHKLPDTPAYVLVCCSSSTYISLSPRTYASIKDRALGFEVLGTLLPAFLYAHSQDYDKNDLETGLLEGHIIRRGVKHIYQGPGAALDGPGVHQGKAGNAAINRMTALTGRDIAYITCQLRFAMSLVETWSLMDGEFSYPDFFWSIVEILTGNEGDAILACFNHDVFGTAAPKTVTSTDDIPNEFALLQAQRAAKRAHAAATPPASAAPAVPAA
ncbi:hypothetical protein B0H17DRAFT_1131127 [Mycena rosella]|uniref:Uncharacterized protein n=1 Tax=Mycena rosella TaxID=1033263 RepID=A0AAD7DNC7_MYCRO|nr:hypothetical protein B0H17DRAFT_1131127 [Mycena rosella]